MQKLTAGIFAGILTIVSVNAASAAITSKAYVDDLNKATNALVTKNAGDITTLKTTVEGNTTNITNLQNVIGDEDKGLVADVAALQESVGEGGSVADQIASELGKLDVENTLTTGQVATSVAQADGKIVVSGALISNANVATDAAIADTKISFSEAHTAALDSGITAAGVTQITTNKNDITTIEATIGEIAEGKTVAGLIEEAQTAASTGVDEKLEDYSTTTEMNAKLAEKQDTLGTTNVKEDGAGNAIIGISAADGVVTAKRGAVMPEVPATAKGEAGTYVLTAVVTDSGVANYQWEFIERAAAAAE